MRKGAWKKYVSKLTGALHIRKFAAGAACGPRGEQGRGASCSMARENTSGLRDPKR